MRSCVASTIGAFFLATAPLHGCTEECTSLPPAFQLDVRAPSGAASLAVTLTIGGEARFRIFDLEGTLDDGETSLVVELDPAVSGPFELVISAAIHSEPEGLGPILAEGRRRFPVTPDGCNHFLLDLGPPEPTVDAGVRDGGVEACNPACAGGECAVSCAAACAFCQLSCAGSVTSCTASCQNDSNCMIDCAGIGECQANCSGTSSCEVDCSGTQECKSRCVGQATCRLDCRDAAECTFMTCDGVETTCADGSIVCDRACP